jgi:hypothetical protein
MRELENALHKIQASHSYAKGHPNSTSGSQVCHIKLPIRQTEVTELDLELIKVLLAYRKEVENRAEEAKAEEFYKQKNDEPSEEAKELVSFVYDHMDKFEEVLSEEESNELESLMMNVS